MWVPLKIEDYREVSMTEAELNKQHYVKTLSVTPSVYVNALSPRKELEILGDTCIVKNWNSITRHQQGMFIGYLEKSANELGKVLNRVLK